MKEQIFKRKNDIGVEIEYSIVGNFNNNNEEYIIYTDFVPVDKYYQIRLFVDKKVNKHFKRLNNEQEEEIIKKFCQEAYKNSEVMLK